MRITASPIAMGFLLLLVTPALALRSPISPVRTTTPTFASATSTTLPLPPPVAPGAPKILRITSRSHDEIGLTWRDLAPDEQANTLQRRAYGPGQPGTWESINAFGPLFGWPTYLDSGLRQDRLYCYRVRTLRLGVTTYSPIRCAYTGEDVPRPVWRVQLELITADVERADTDDAVTVALNSRVADYQPGGNYTWLDYGRNDFERGKTHMYDLDLAHVGQLADITQISIRKKGADDWCLDQLRLLVNDVEVYSEGYGASCLKITDSHTVNHDSLRGHPSWQGYVTPNAVDRDGDGEIDADVLALLLAGESVEVMRFTPPEIESRIEGIVGHALYEFAPIWGVRARWGDRVGPRHVEAQWKGAWDALHVDLDLKLDVPNLRDATLDVDFDLAFSTGCRPDGTGIDFGIATRNFVPTLDSDWVNEVLGTVVGNPFCFAIGAIAGKTIADCVTSLEDYVEEKIAAKFDPLPEQLRFDSEQVRLACSLGYRPRLLLGPEGVSLQITPPSAVCGNGRIEPWEVCDGDLSCPTSAATIRCLDCQRLDSSACTLDSAGGAFLSPIDGSCRAGRVCCTITPCGSKLCRTCTGGNVPRTRTSQGTR